MITLRRGVLLVALSAACGLGLAAPARADAIITSPNGVFSVGLTNAGNLYTDLGGALSPGVGFQRSGGYDPIVGNFSDGFTREYWGVSAGAFHGFADPANAGVLNLAPNTPATPGPGNHSATVSVFLTNGGATHVLQIDQTYTFPLNNVLKIHVTLTNLTTSPLTNVMFRRGSDVDIAPFTSGGATVQTMIVPTKANPVNATTIVDLDPADPTLPYSAQPSNVGDRAEGFTLSLGNLDGINTPNGHISTSFDIFEGINNLNESASALLADLQAAGSTYTILGFTGANTGVSNSALSNSAAIGVAIPSVPEPATISLLGVALIGLAARRLRRRPE